MKYFFILVCFLIFSLPTAFAVGGCFQDKQLNAALEKDFKTTCDKFPEIIEKNYLYLSFTGDVSLTEKDVLRLVKLKTLSVSPTYEMKDAKLRLTFQGMIDLPLLTSLNTQGFKFLDVKGAQFRMPMLKELGIYYFEEFFSLVKQGQIPGGLEKLKIVTSKDLELTSSDFSFLKSLTSLEVSGDDSDSMEPTVKLKLVGEIDLPVLTSLDLAYVIHSIDASAGSIKTPPLEELAIIYSEDFPRMLERKVLTSIMESLELTVPVGQEVHLDFTGIVLGAHVKISGASSVSNLDLSASEYGNLTLEGPENGKVRVSNTSFKGRRVTLTNVTLLNLPKPFAFDEEGELELKGIHFDGELIAPNSKIDSIELVRSKIRLPTSTDVSELSSLSLENSSLTGVVIGSKLPRLYDLTLSNAEITLEALPESVKMRKITISGKVTILDQSKPLRVNDNKTHIILDVPNLSHLEIDLIEPKNLQSLYLFGSDSGSVSILNQENAGKLPASFKLVVRKKEDALKLRKVLGRKSVAFTDEMY